MAKIEIKIWPLQCYYAASTTDHLDTGGHSFLDTDSMYAQFEKARPHKWIYTTGEYGISKSKTVRMQHCNIMHFSDFMDWKCLSAAGECKGSGDGMNKVVIRDDDKEETVSWLRIKWLKFEKKNPNVIKFKYDLMLKNFVNSTLQVLILMIQLVNVVVRFRWLMNFLLTREPTNLAFLFQAQKRKICWVY